MKSIGLIFVLVAGIFHGACTSEDSDRRRPQAELARLLYEDSVSRVPGEYVVVFKDNVTDDEVSNHMLQVRQLISRRDNNTNVIIRELKIGNICGYGAKMDNVLRDRVRAMNIVSYVESNQLYNATKAPIPSCLTQQDAPWGIVRTTLRNEVPWAFMSYKYREHAGQDVTIYILDTGIDISHPDFGNRAFLDSGFPPTTLPYNGLDLNGHGTHVSGTVMSDTFGVAKKATAVSIPVLNQYGSGSTMDVETGITLVAEHRHSPGDLSIINMSLGGPYSMSLNAVTNEAVDLGVHVVVSAGNSRADACNVSPASATKVITVAASDRHDVFADFSNYGSCVDIIAPGVCVTSTWLDNNIRTIRGTSMAAPHVAGVMAKYLSLYPSTTPAGLKAMISATACQNQVDLSGVPGSTPNRLVFKECESDGTVVYIC